ncbi:MAG: FAD-binding oxidoreductase [Alphaproteobacteria bacterium]|nr:FAD-binding oxidoreductase [Alphaproteobacteria bacterium]
MNDAPVTTTRDLRTGRPVWLDSPGIGVACRGRIARSAYDVVIVGAGISGAMLAYRLRRQGGKVLVVDRRRPLHGSTAASTALLQFEIDTPLFALSRTIGREAARRAWRRSVAAVGDLHRLVRRERIRCGWRDARTLYLAGDAYGRIALRAEAEARAAAGISGSYLDHADLSERFGIDRTGAILSAGSAQADPMQLAAGLLRRAVAKGVRICAPVEIAAIAASGDGVALATADGTAIAARAAVFCTGYEILKAIPDQGHAIRSTWALASARGATAPDWLADHLVWEGADPYLYLRRSADGRIIAGGEDEPWSEAHADTRLLREKTRRIARKVRALIPGLRFRVAHRWAGAFGESRTGLPFIDRVPGHPHCYAVMGFGGNGITYSMIASDIVAALLAGEDDPDADLYRFRV